MSIEHHELNALEEQVAELDAQRLAWKWSPNNRLAALEAKILHVLEQLIELYPIVTDAERDYIRGMLRKHPGVAMYSQKIATGDMRKFKSEIAPDHLYPALTAVSMANSDFGDYRDLLVLLGSLWLRAAQGGIDPAPYFNSVAALSDTAARYPGGLSMKDTLANFDKSAYFKEDVEPELSK